MLNIDNNSLVYLAEQVGGIFTAKQDGKVCSKVEASSGDYWIVKKGVPITIELLGSSPVDVTIATATSPQVPIVGYATITTEAPCTFITYAELTVITNVP